MDQNQVISILRETHQSYTQKVKEKLGKGHVHAGLLYDEWFRFGKREGKGSAFRNAAELREKIESLTDDTLLEWVKEEGEGETRKWLFRTHDGLDVETVYIPMQAGGTLCVSSQVGCRMGCTFCETGRMGLFRNLTAEEIVSQVFQGRFERGASIRSVVFMGMGEPLDNYDEVMQAVRVLSDPSGLAFGMRQITISTSGCVEEIKRLSYEQETPNLAVSISAPTNELRDQIMPINRKHDLAALYEAMRFYNEKTGRSILVAYVLLKGVNDSLSHADQLADFLDGLPVKVNLIPYNPQSNDRYQRVEYSDLQLFADRLQERGYQTLLRVTKGDEIMAACGQLGNLKLRKQRLFSNRCLKQVKSL